MGRSEEATRETLAELGQKNGSRPLLERATETLAELGEAIELDEIAALRSDSTAKAMAAYRKGMEAAIARVAEAGEGGAAYGHAADSPK